MTRSLNYEKLKMTMMALVLFIGESKINYILFLTNYVHMKFVDKILRLMEVYWEKQNQINGMPEIDKCIKMAFAPVSFRGGD